MGRIHKREAYPRNHKRMVRTYVRKTAKGAGPTYSEEDLQKALDDVQNGNRTIRGAAIFYHIPRSSLKFFKRLCQSMKFFETGEESLIANQDFVRKLSQPVKSSSARFKDMISFNTDLSDLSMF
ncbi:unnamed protein product [Acanthoscelides obtectus]|uniref:HTH psq-type domain-containing protein n=1 Tax=Acanthoscelides obtectus TaxID=200917 RepID=A0A9P0KCD7_ACAOB|nr:unnamed protein product [Acanthoscelides obtectus]CAK1657633.1 hypothetical protein AOBTE_LOCUS20449 [Acanthoscelides obtectus]